MSIFAYTVEIDTQRDGTFGDALDDVTDYVEMIDWRAGLTEPWGQVAPSATMRLLLSNTDGRFSTHDSSAAYYGLLSRGMLVRIRATYGVTTETLCVLKTKDIDIKPVGAGTSASNVVTLICTDIMPKLLQTQYEAPLLFDVRIDEALTMVYDNATIIYPYEGSSFYIGVDSIGGSKLLFENDVTDFDEAYTTLPYIGDNMDKGRGIQAQAYIKDVVAAEPNSIFFFQPRDELFKFYNQFHNHVLSNAPTVLNASKHSFEMADYAKIIMRHGENLINDYRLNYSPRKIGSAGTVIYESSSVPVSIPPSESRDFTFRYYDPDNPSAKIGAMDVIEPVMGFDIIGNQFEDGSHNDLTYLLSVTRFEAGAGSVKLTVHNSWVDQAVYITTFQIRGTPIISYEMEQVTAHDGISISQNDRHAKADTIKSVSNVDKAQSYADFMVNTFATPQTYIRSVDFVADEARDAIALQLLQRTIGDIVTLADDTGVDKNYMIVGEKHTLPSKTEVHNISWVLRPTDKGAPFIIGTSEIGGTDMILG